MKELLLNKKEFVNLYGRSQFELNPLDVNLVKIQQSFTQRIKSELFDNPESNTLSETYDSRNPEAHFSSVKVECHRNGDRLWPYDIWLTVCDVRHEREREVRVFAGDEQSITDFLNSNKFLSKCKDEVLYINYEYKHYHTFRDYTEQLILRIAKRAESEVPENGDFVPVLEMFVNPSVEDKHIVGQYGLEIFKMPNDVEPDPAKRFLRANAYEPSAQYKAGMVITSGTKAEILDWLRTEDIGEAVGYFWGDLKDSLKDL